MHQVTFQHSFVIWWHIGICLSLNVWLSTEHFFRVLFSLKLRKFEGNFSAINDSLSGENSNYIVPQLLLKTGIQPALHQRQVQYINNRWQLKFPNKGIYVFMMTLSFQRCSASQFTLPVSKHLDLQYFYPVEQ